LQHVPQPGDAVERLHHADVRVTVGSVSTERKSKEGDPAVALPAGRAPGPSWSAGSALHGAKACVPCAFYYSKLGCKEGSGCVYCHLCGKAQCRRRLCERRRAKRALYEGVLRLLHSKA